jgi:hypothetical protein
VADEHAGRAPTSPGAGRNGWTGVTPRVGAPGIRDTPRRHAEPGYQGMPGSRPRAQSARAPGRPGGYGYGAAPDPQFGSGPGVRHNLVPPRGPVDSQRRAAARRNRRLRGWLLVIPIVAPLLSPLTNTDTPELWGIPFFYWYQMFCALLAIAVITTVFLMSRKHS